MKKSSSDLSAFLNEIRKIRKSYEELQSDMKRVKRHQQHNNQEIMRIRKALKKKGILLI